MTKLYTIRVWFLQSYLRYSKNPTCYKTQVFILRIYVIKSGKSMNFQCLASGNFSCTIRVTASRRRIRQIDTPFHPTASSVIKSYPYYSLMECWSSYNWERQLIFTLRTSYLKPVTTVAEFKKKIVLNFFFLCWFRMHCCYYSRVYLSSIGLASDGRFFKS